MSCKRYAGQHACVRVRVMGVKCAHAGALNRQRFCDISAGAFAQSARSAAPSGWQQQQQYTDPYRP